MSTHTHMHLTQAAQASALVRPKHTALPLNLCHSEHQLAAQKEFAKACKVRVCVCCSAPALAQSGC
jgi:hypothetical protein